MANGGQLDGVTVLGPGGWEALHEAGVVRQDYFTLL